MPQSRSSSTMISIQSIDRREDLPYTLNGSVGLGAYGTVLSVTRKQDKALFALKVMHTQKRNQNFIMDLLQEEVKNIRALQDHHHFIRVYEAYETRTEVGLIMWPLADRRSLAHCLEEYLESGDSSLVPIFDKAFACLASGLAFMHAKHIRHKDIKPANILVHEGCIYYCDFGHSYNSTLLANSTTDGPAYATRMYMAPEVMANESRNSKSDVYSLGCVFLELMFALELREEVNVTSFSRDMTTLHHQLQTVMPNLGEQRGKIATETFNMTEYNASDRRSSAQLAQNLCATPSSCCEPWQKMGPIGAWAIPAGLDRTEFHSRDDHLQSLDHPFAGRRGAISM